MLWIFLAYLGILLALGFMAERYTKSLESFLLGDRKMGPWLTALSYEATAYSGWLMLGFPGRAFSRGLAAIWAGVACVIGDSLNWILVSKRLRDETGRLRALTVPEYLERRFPKEDGHAVQLVASAALGFFMLIYLWAQFVAAGKAMMTMLDWSYLPAVALSAIVIIIYTFQGGYRAVVWTDAFQAVMMLVALVILPLACISELGGLSGLRAALARASSEAASSASLASTSSHLESWFAGLVGLSLFTFLFEDAGLGAGYLGQPHISVRFMAVRDSRALRPAFVLSIFFAILVCAGAVAAGLSGHGTFQFADTASGPSVPSIPSIEDARQPLHDPESILPRLAMAVLPPWLAGLVTSAIMAAIMSTASGFLLSVTSSMTEDVYHRLLRPAAAQKELVLVSRAVTIALGAGALILALSTNPLDPESTVYKLVLYGWGGLAGCFSAPVTLALFYRGMTRAGCLAGMISGALTVLVWRNIPALSGIYEVIPAMAVSALSILLVSRLTFRRAV
ncbi:MAG TPA: sodium/proline symporter [Vicinamibacteria bacterium]|nr:sodium/proline symporter [Vicinamibacteria bacterium]